MSDQSFSLERLIATAFYAPIGLGAKVVEDLPENLEKIRRHVALARFVGKTAVAKGTKELKRRVGPDGPRESMSDVAPPVDDAAVTETSPAEHDVAHDVHAAGHADDLALPDYDHLPATHIVSKLAGLNLEERIQIESYERAHRHRRTVLGKLAQLQES